MMAQNDGKIIEDRHHVIDAQDGKHPRAGWAEYRVGQGGTLNRRDAARGGEQADLVGDAVILRRDHLKSHFPRHLFDIKLVLQFAQFLRAARQKQVVAVGGQGLAQSHWPQQPAAQGPGRRR